VPVSSSAAATRKTGGSCWSSARRLRSEVAPLYRSLQEDLAKVNGRYTNRDLAVVARYMTEALEALARHVEWLQTQPVRRTAGIRRA
jgi:hypothetical protein